MKNEEKSKQVSHGKTLKQDPSANPTSNSEPANKPKLCTVKRVALVKFSPVRRSLRGLATSSRNCTNSPRTGRRRHYFDSLHQKRKSPKLKRRHATPDETPTSTECTPKQKSIDDRERQRLNIEDEKNNNITVQNCATSESQTAVPCDNLASRNSNVNAQKCPTRETSQGVDIPARDKNLGLNTSETVTHLYTDKGVVLKRDPSGEDGNHNAKLKQEQDSVQHHVFHGNKRNKSGNPEDVKDEQGCGRINGVNSKQEKVTNVVSKVEVVNAKISTVPEKIAETAKTFKVMSCRCGAIYHELHTLIVRKVDQGPVVRRFR